MTVRQQVVLWLSGFAAGVWLSGFAAGVAIMWWW